MSLYIKGSEVSKIGSAFISALLRQGLEDVFIFQMFLWVTQCGLGNMLPVGCVLSGPAVK